MTERRLSSQSAVTRLPASRRDYWPRAPSPSIRRRSAMLRPAWDDDQGGGGGDRGWLAWGGSAVDPSSVCMDCSAWQQRRRAASDGGRRIAAIDKQSAASATSSPMPDACPSRGNVRLFLFLDARSKLVTWPPQNGTGYSIAVSNAAYGICLSSHCQTSPAFCLTPI